MSEAIAPKTAEVPEKRKNVQVAATISAEQYDKLVDNKWTARIEVKDQVKAAVETYIENIGK